MGRVHLDGIVEPQGGSQLEAAQVRLAAGGVASLHDPERDELLFVFGGGGSLDGEPVGPGSAAFVAAGESATLIAGSDGLSALGASIGVDVDLHAPMGPRARVVSVHEVEPGKATGSRSFQVLFGPHNGSTRATMFVGYIPPGAAPWHYHLYEEIVWIWEGSGRFHLAAGVEELVDGSAFYLSPREVHIVENLSSDRELAVVGIFTPAGTPSAAYLMPDVARSYETSYAIGEA
jgi:quercetin dioxygenase-like cupin family protein